VAVVSACKVGCSPAHGPVCDLCGGGHWLVTVQKHGWWDVCVPCWNWWQTHGLSRSVYEMGEDYIYYARCGALTALSLALRDTLDERRIFGDLKRSEKRVLLARLQTYRREETLCMVDDGALLANSNH
jgi:hypothetical protein